LGIFRALGILSITFLSLLKGYSQHTDSLFTCTEHALHQIIKLYDRTLKQNSFLYTGRIYTGEYNDLRGHQFFQEDYLNLGKITFQGESFDSVYLMYDIYNDLVLLESNNDYGVLSPIVLDNEKISNVELHGHFFINLKSGSDNGIKPGLYDQLFNGKHVAFYAGRKKKITKSREGNEIWESFIEDDTYFIKIDKEFHRIKKKKSVYKLLKDDGSIPKSFFRFNSIDPTTDFELSVIRILEYYESLK
jgi:hypothetical protein